MGGLQWSLGPELVTLREEESHKRRGKPSAIGDRIEKRQGFLHPIDSLVFNEELVVRTYVNGEDDCIRRIEGMYPLFPPGAGTADIIHIVFADCCGEWEGGLRDSRSFDTIQENVSVRWNIVRVADPLYAAEKAQDIVLPHSAHEDCEAHCAALSAS